jgi:hypothetical protein
MNEILTAQFVYILILTLITFRVKKVNKNWGDLYWFLIIIDILYTLFAGWMIYEYSTFGKKVDPGAAFAWGMMFLLVPGILVFAALVAILVAKAMIYSMKIKDP